MDITDINYCNNSFDSIICNHVLEHIEDDKLAMSELFRVLKPNGIAILQVPICDSELTEEDASFNTNEMRLQEYGQIDHVRLYGQDYKKRLKAVGFMVEEVKWLAFPNDFGSINNRFSLIEKEVLYVARKKKF